MKDTDALRKIQGLLAKAEAEGVTEAEADMLFAKAAELTARYGIDEALLAAKAAHNETPDSRMFVVYAPCVIDRCSLWNTITKFNRCKSIRIKRIIEGKQRMTVTIVGFKSDLDVCELLFTSLSLQIDQRLRRIKSYSGGATKSARVQYFAGFTSAVYRRLEAEAAKAEAEKEQSEPGTALVLADRSTLVQNEFANLFPDTRNVKRYMKMSSHYRDGQAHGQRANLHNRAEAGTSNSKGLGR